MRIAYVRCSTAEQNEARQVESLEKYGIERWYTEKISGKDANRPKLQEMLGYVRDGDTIHIHDLSRLARSTADLLVIVDLLAKKGVHLVSNKENIDSSTPTGKLMLTMIGAINEFERTNILERTREGIAIAKREGVYKGRKPIDLPENWDAVTKTWSAGRITAREAMQQLNLKPNTFYRLCAKQGIRKNKRKRGQFLPSHFPF